MSFQSNIVKLTLYQLRVFFSQKLDGRRIRIAIYLLEHLEDSIADCKCLARGTVTSAIGGGFKSISSFPAVLADTGRYLGGESLRVVTELIPAQDDETEGSAPGRIDSAVVKVHPANVVRVISDIDDTIKHTQVLKGIRTVFRNVFTLPFDRIAVPVSLLLTTRLNNIRQGMSEWYQAMSEQGVGIHYVSNGPWELSQVVKDFMTLVGLPSGQIKLKEYTGGGGLLSDMWTSPGQRKRGNVEEVLKAFPESKWILIGDSGEQDLELFSSIAQQYSQQIVAIFIRDVTTPLSIKPSDIQKGVAAITTETLNPPKKSRRRGISPSSRKNSVDEARPPLPAGRQMSEPAADYLSPNNPLEQTDNTLPKLVMGFYRRIAAAETLLPDGCILRIFREGSECEQEALEIIDQEQVKMAQDAS